MDSNFSQQVWSRQMSDASGPLVTPFSHPSIPLCSPPHPTSPTTFSPRIPSPTKVENARFRAFGKNALWTDQRMDGLTDGRTDRPSYRDAWTHLTKKKLGIHFQKMITNLLIRMTHLIRNSRSRRIQDEHPTYISSTYRRYGIQWCFPDETEEERIKRENRVQKKLHLKAQAEKKASKQSEREYRTLLLHSFFFYRCGISTNF